LPRAVAVNAGHALPLKAACAARTALSVSAALALGIKAQVFPVEGSKLSNVAKSSALQNAPSI
jgi:hypothetical protein